MGWLDASECFLMEVVVEDRGGDPYSTFGVTWATDNDDSDTALRPATADGPWCLRGVWARS